MRVGRYINEVCQSLDINVLHDVEAVSDEENELCVRACVALGERAEHAAGLVGFTVTRWFPTEEELDEFCELNINRFRNAAAECDNGAPVPDATAWI